MPTRALPHVAAGAAGALPWHVRQQQAVLDSWFFAPAAEDRPLLPRDRRELM